MESGRYIVYLALEPGEADALARAEAGPRVAGLLGAEVIWDESEDPGPDVLAVSVQEVGDQRAAVAAAAAIYDRCRETAGLSPREPVVDVVTKGGDLVDSMRHFTLQQHARQLAAEGRYSLAVIVAQTACETFAEDGILRLLRRQMPKDLADLVVGPGTSWNLKQGRAQRIFTALTGQHIQRQAKQAGWWDDYLRHVDLRNDIVHSGATASQQQAAESIEAMDAFLGYLPRAILAGWALAATRARRMPRELDAGN